MLCTWCIPAQACTFQRIIHACMHAVCLYCLSCQTCLICLEWSTLILLIMLFCRSQTSFCPSDSTARLVRCAHSVLLALHVNLCLRLNYLKYWALLHFAMSPRIARGNVCPVAGLINDLMSASVLSSMSVVEQWLILDYLDEDIICEMYFSYSGRDCKEMLGRVPAGFMETGKDVWQF